MARSASWSRPLAIDSLIVEHRVENAGEMRVQFGDDLRYFRAEKGRAALYSGCRGQWDPR
jgi:hypothetical protein